MTRLDTFLYENHYTQSRNRAKELIKNSLVMVDDEIISRPSHLVLAPTISILAKNQYVSRGGDKLKGFLENYHIDIKDKICLDIGSSTGGFSEVLLEYGASEVHSVDVGKDQLHPSLKDNPKIKSYEECDIRDFRSRASYSVVTCDVSFVGSEHILPDIDRLSSDNIIMLFKPQFEVGRGVKRSKKGVVKDEIAIINAQKKFEENFKKYNWNMKKREISFVKGKEGNVEIFYHFKKI
jgi:23S rRNA (cytidine1920-2'-O)/16S rRNA (cytidine1409-2'-O)-methyltransferase